MKKVSGFTLIELIITLAVGAVVVTIAVPAFTNVIKSNRLTAQVNMFVTSMNYARSEAINRRQNYSVVAENGDWTQGWTIQDAGGNPVRTSPALHATSHFDTDQGIATFTYLPNGRISGGTIGSDVDTLTMCDDRTNERGRQITISPAGRITVVPITCTN